MQRILVPLLACLILGCSQPIPDFESLKQQTAQVPFVQTWEQDPYLLRVSYRPPWLLAARDLEALRDQSNLSVESIEHALSAHRGSLQFVLKVGPHPDLSGENRKQADIVNYQASMENFSRNLHHLIYGLNDKIYLVTSKGMKVPVSQYLLDRNWGLTPNNYLSISFPTHFEACDLTKENALELVVQNLHPNLPECRFDFRPSPIPRALYSPSELLKSLQKPSVKKPEEPIEGDVEPQTH